MNVERFEPEQGCYNCEGGKMYQYAEGEYVRYSDYAALTAELEAVLREIEREIRDLARRVADYGLAGMTGKSRLDELADRLQTSLAALSAQGAAVAEVYAGAFGIHYIACADPNKLPVGTKLYLHPAPPGSDAVTEEMAADVLHRFNATAPSGDHWPPERCRELRIKAMQQAITNAALAARTGKGE